MKEVVHAMKEGMKHGKVKSIKLKIKMHKGEACEKALKKK